MTVIWNGEEIAGRVHRAVWQSVIRGSMAVANEAVRRIREPPKTGRIYRRRGVEHQASKAGESPAADLGTLENSVDVEFHESELLGIVYADAPHAEWMELGTRRIRPRPYMGPALASRANAIQLDMARAALAAL